MVRRSKILPHTDPIWLQPDPMVYYTPVSEQKKRWSGWKKALFISGCVLFTLMLILFIVVWVVFPVLFRTMISIQRFFVFMNVNDPKNPDFNNPKQYDIDGVLNFHVTVSDFDTSQVFGIGTWIISPTDEIDSFNAIVEKYNSPNNETVAEILAATKKPIVLYLHGVGCNRIKARRIYKVIRDFFMVIAVDHRGYGDSTHPDIQLTENGIINDTAQVYKWIRAYTDKEIFVWGHSLGGAISSHTLRNLNEQHDIVPMGLIVESSFSTLRDEGYSMNAADWFRWLAYFNASFLDPLERNGFLFKSTSNIQYVDCPIMILHAQDDNIIPYTLGKKLYEVAESHRLPTQGNVTYHQFASVGYKHVNIVIDPHIPELVENFIASCREQNKMHG